MCVCVGGGGGGDRTLKSNCYYVCVLGAGLAISIFGRGMFTDLFIYLFLLSLSLWEEVFTDLFI